MADDASDPESFDLALERFIAVAEFVVTENDQDDVSIYGVSQTVAPLFAKAFHDMERARALDPYTAKQERYPLGLSLVPTPIEDIPSRAGRTIYHTALNEARKRWGCLPRLFQETKGPTWIGWVIPQPWAINFPFVHFTIHPSELETLRAAVRMLRLESTPKTPSAATRPPDCQGSQRDVLCWLGYERKRSYTGKLDKLEAREAIRLDKRSLSEKTHPLILMWLLDEALLERKPRRT
jgi:hypothetical protein